MPAVPAVVTSKRKRLGRRLALAWFLFSVALLVWPIFPWVGNYVYPRVFGIPWSLTWVLLVIAANFVVLLVLHRWRIVDDVEPPSTEKHERGEPPRAERAERGASE